MFNHRFISYLIVLTALLWSGVAFAQDWKDTFEADAVHSYMSANGQKYIVVAAGGAGDSVEAAALGLEAALRSGPAKLVMNDDALGSVEGLDDDAIIEKAAALPIDRIAIVRVFAGATEADETVVVTVRNKDGQSLWALSAARGTSVETRSGSGGLGVSSGAAESVSSTVRASGKSTRAAQQEFAEKFLWPHTIQYLEYGGNTYQGIYQKQLTPEEFYREVGRPDLAEELASNQTQATIGYTVGTIGTVGLVAAVPWWIFEWAGSMNADNEANYTGPIVLSAASLAMLIAAPFIVPNQIQPVTSSEAMKLADQHNRKLKVDLGLDDDYTVTPQEDETNSMKFNYGINPTLEGVSGAIRIDF